MKYFVVSILFLFEGLSLHQSKACDHPAIHGMTIFGKGSIYLSHLPMFHQPHDYQVIVEASLKKADRDNYIQDQISHPDQTLYTIEPLEKFSLPDEIQGLKSFQATLYRGHFERGGVPIATGISIQISRVIYFKQFEPAATKPGQLTYLIFGHPGEFFMAHWIVAKPDFDQIASVSFNASEEASLLQDHPFSFFTVGGHSDGKPLEGIDATQLTSFKELYLEFGDLSQ